MLTFLKVGIVVTIQLTYGVKLFQFAVDVAVVPNNLCFSLSSNERSLESVKGSKF
jgi:hypothetical protein